MRLRNDKRDERQKQATERNSRWQGLSTEEKIRSLSQRRGASKKQVSLLTGVDQTAKQAFAQLKPKAKTKKSAH